MIYVDAYQLFGDENGEYTDRLEIDGETVRVRVGDGVHLTPAGAEYLAEPVFALLDGRFHIAAQADPSHPINYTMQTGRRVDEQRRFRQRRAVGSGGDDGSGSGNGGGTNDLARQQFDHGRDRHRARRSRRRRRTRHAAVDRRPTTRDAATTDRQPTAPPTAPRRTVAPTCAELPTQTGRSASSRAAPTSAPSLADHV